MFNGRATKFVKATSFALSACAVVTCWTGVRGLVGSVEVCYGDFLRVCHPVAPPPLMRLLLGVGTIAAFWIFLRIGIFSEGVVRKVPKAN